MSEPSFPEIYTMAAQDAMRNGVGIIVLMKREDGIEVSRATKDQYLELAELLIHITRTSKESN